MKRMWKRVFTALVRMRGNFNLKSEMGVLFVYRAISLLLTSAFYLFGESKLPFAYKAGTTAALFAASIAVLGIYAGLYKENRKIPPAMVLVETIGLMMLLIPTGGLSSSFLWYALNPVLVSACFLPAVISWCNLVFFCCCATAVSFFMFNPSAMALSALVAANSYVFLVFALITYAVLLLARLLHKSALDAAVIEKRRSELEELNRELIEANERAAESMEQVKILLVEQEQNRIAGEMHDSVSQRLFSMVCALHAMERRWNSMTKAEIKDMLEPVAQCAVEANKELRGCIYSLKGEDRSRAKNSRGFFDELKRYLDNAARLNDLSIDTDFLGDEALLSAELKHTAHRMLRETVSNAIRHGQCAKIGVRLHIFENELRLEVEDDGNGVDAVELGPEQSHGMGLSNMRAMARELNGEFSINSVSGAGTEVLAVLPLQAKRTYGA